MQKYHISERYLEFERAFDPSLTALLEVSHICHLSFFDISKYPACSLKSHPRTYSIYKAHKTNNTIFRVQQKKRAAYILML